MVVQGQEKMAPLKYSLTLLEVENDWYTLIEQSHIRL